MPGPGEPAVRRSRAEPAVRYRCAALLLVAGLALTGCIGTAGEQAEPTEEQAVPTEQPDPSRSARATGGSRRAADDLPPVRSAYSLPQLMRERFRGSRLTRTALEYQTADYTRHRVTYRSGGVRVSGVLLVPRGRGPFPGVVLAHGYIEPSIYVAGQGLAREQDALARAGFVVLHTDYRGHAGSDPATPLSRETRLGYTRDVLHAVAGLKRERYVDADRVSLLGRSMGGGVVLNALVAKPGTVRSAVVYASVSSAYLDNLRRWTLPERPEAARALFDRFGDPRRSPGFYRGLSARTYLDRITEPVLMFHGTSDDSCPIAWSRTTDRLLRRAGVPGELVVYQGEEHAFGPRWQDSIERSIAFLSRRG